ncbi:MAG TPA: hypothetical protein VNA16_06010, partial [Abditibacteriaceae bacterium]|nr:hypothetical protein [Abditibacteriaceae bacterium]
MKAKFIVILFCLGLTGLAGAWWLGRGKREPPLPPSRVVTVAKIPYGSGPGQMAHLAKDAYEPMKGLFAVKPRAVDDAGYIY